MGWRVKKDGATIIVVTGSIPSPNGPIPVTNAVVGRVGQLIEGELTDDFVQRWEEGDPGARALVERIDSEGNLVGDDEEERPETDQGLIDENASLRDQAAGLLARVAELEQANEAITAERNSLQSEVASLQSNLETVQADAVNAAAAAAAAAETPPAAEGDQYDPTAHNVDDVLAYLATADAAEVARVQSAEAAGSRSSTQIANYQPKEAAPAS